MEIEQQAQKRDRQGQPKQNSVEIDKDISGLVIKIVRVIKQFPATLGPIFENALNDDVIPCWVFLNYLPQIMFILNKENIVKYFKPLFQKIFQFYPDALIYHFNIVYERESDCETDFCIEIYQMLRKSLPQYFEFMQALNSLTHPQHRLIYYLDQYKEHIPDLFVPNINTNSNNNNNQQNPITNNNYRKLSLLFEAMLEDIFSDHGMYGKYNQQFSTKWRKEVTKLEPVIKKLEKDKQKQDVPKLDTILQDIKEKAKKDSTNIPDGNMKLSDFSEWLALFQQEERLEIPGQYDGSMNQTQGIQHEPYPEGHVVISSFDQQILTLKSIRKPKKLVFYGSDEKAYSFLMKGIEDVRQDQRIEQLFEVMNNIFEIDAECCKRELSLSTFQIVPMTKILGVLEWVHKTKVMKDILEKELAEQLPGSNIRDCEAWRARTKYLGKLKQNNIVEQHIELLKIDYRGIIKEFENNLNLMPGNLLRNATERLAANADAYIYLKQRFIKNFAVICVCGYILGIGDRHLENFLVNYATGDIILIDFGISFGEGLNLAIPELMPFRLTRIFEQLLQPIGVNGMFRHSMIFAMHALKKKRHLLLDFCEVFINDPIMDWVKVKDDRRGTSSYLSSLQETSLSQQYQDEQSSLWSAISEGQSIRLTNLSNPIGKIQVVKMKLMGMKSAKIMIDELEQGKHKGKDFLKNLKEVLNGQGDRKRKEYKQDFLTVEQQIDYLIDHGTDPNILGRTWIGWSPFV